MSVPMMTSTPRLSVKRAALLAGTMLSATALLSSGAFAETSAQARYDASQEPLQKSLSGSEQEYCDRLWDHLAEDWVEADCDLLRRAKMLDYSDVDLMPIGENTEYRTTYNASAPLEIPLWITVDGEPMDVVGFKTPAKGQEEAQRIEDLRLEAVDIQVKFDGLDLTPTLNVSTKPIERLFKPGEEIAFFGSWNYPAWIANREVRIYDALGDLVAQLPMDANGNAVWAAPALIEDEGDSAFGKEYSYVLRVYDAQGRFDETVPLPLKLTDEDWGTYLNKDEEGRIYAESHFASEVPGYGEDRTALRNIPLYGGVVTVAGKNIPEGHSVSAFGRRVPIDPDGNFVMQEIIPAGDATVQIAVLGEAGEGLTFEREVRIPDNEWFYVGLLDLAAGRSFRHEDRIEAIDEDERERWYTSGRAAMYLKGKIRGRYLLTGAVDTSDQAIEDLLRNLDEKDPRRLLRRLDPDDYYPVYGDDSTTFDDAPTRGKFYVRLERGDSHVMWGNFKTRITGTEFARHQRGLYGAHALFRSDESTSFGERRVSVHGFAAEPGTTSQRDQFRGTGGSAYFLRRQDITTGSETLTIDIRDRITGLSKERRVLRPEEDYTIDYIQGVVILREALGSTSVAGEIVRDTQTGGDPVYLVAQYEHTPVTGDLQSYAFGTRTQAWLNDYLRVGVSGFFDKANDDQSLLEGDVTFRVTDKTYLEAEIGFSEGSGAGNTSSVDGGFRFDDPASVGSTDEEAIGVRVRAVAGLQDLGILTDGQVGVYYEDRETGFVALDRTTSEDTQTYGAFATVEISDKTSASLRLDTISRETSGDEREAALQVESRINNQWSLGLGATVSDRDNLAGSDDTDGVRTDIGARVTYDQPGYSLYGFGQVTADAGGNREDNHRLGLGAKVDLSDRFSINGEASFGSLGFGALAGVDYAPTADQHYYFGYRLDADRTDGDLDSYDPFGRDVGSFVFGAKRTLSDKLSVYGEENFDLIGHRQSLTHTYGVTYTPDDVWRFHGSAEAGQFKDDQNGDEFDRTAISAGIDFSDQGRRFGLRGEARFEEGENNAVQDRNTYLISSSAGFDYDPSWRFLTHFDAVISESDQSDFLDGDYVEGSIGLAYRPVDNDRLNALARYTFLYDLPGAQQENALGNTENPRQRSHIISLDATYDLNEVFSIGGKYGYRIGQVESGRLSGNFLDSSAHLGVLRLDMHIVKDWDALLEGRILNLPEAESTRTGALAAIYRHIGDNLKIGVGYNFADFSDDLTDQTFDDQGIFVNVIGKF